MQLIPLPDFQASFQRDGVEVARNWFSPSLHRPFIFPVIGPSGRSLTRMGSPHEPQSHSHHNSVWIGHNDVNGTDFWTDVDGTGRIVHQTTVQFTDGEDAATCLTVNAWTTKSSAVLLTERRLITVKALANDELMLTIDLQLEPRDACVTLGKTPYGLIGVRMAETIGVSDGGGTIRNSEGGVDEPNVFWKRAKWVDYAGPITNKAEEGITLMDHPENPNHPTFFHVRRDGWMGSSLTLDEARTVTKEKPLRMRYGLYVHNGIPPLKVIEERWGEFAREPLPGLVLKHK